jgi:D-glycero-D-manno-heptose 1,7-bisphosphate phosphatase
VGDSLRDLQAGVAAGCAPHLVLTGKGAKYHAKPADLPEGTRVHADLAAFADYVLASAA